MKNNIVLIGFMGCGKTTVGEKLAERLAYSFLDTDLYIENREGKTISEIFEQDGEKYFRDTETKSIQELVESTEKTIVSSGGGLPLRAENAKLLQKLGFVIYLKVKKETVLSRLEGDTTRPLLAGGNIREKITHLMDMRLSDYLDAAEVIIDTDGRSCYRSAG